MTRVRSPTDRRPGFLNSAPTFDVRQRPISKCDAPKWGHTQIGGPSNGRACHRRFELLRRHQRAARANRHSLVVLQPTGRPDRIGWAERVGSARLLQTSTLFASRKARTIEIVAVGFSSMIQWPESGIMPSLTLLAAKRITFAMIVPNDFSPPI